MIQWVWWLASATRTPKALFLADSTALQKTEVLQNYMAALDFRCFYVGKMARAYSKLLFLYFVQHPTFHPWKSLTLLNASWYTWNPCVISMTPNQGTANQEEARIAGNVHCVTVGIFRGSFIELVAISDIWVRTLSCRRRVQALWGRATPRPTSFGITSALQSFLAQKVESLVTLIRDFTGITKLLCHPAGMPPIFNHWWRLTVNNCERDTGNSSLASTSKWTVLTQVQRHHTNVYTSHN